MSKIVSLRAVSGSSWFEVYDPGADQWRLWKMFQSCLMDDGEFHSHCCASRCLPPLPAVVSLCSDYFAFFTESFINNTPHRPASLLNSTGLHSHSIQLIQEVRLFLEILKNGKKKRYSNESLIADWAKLEASAPSVAVKRIWLLQRFCGPCFQAKKCRVVSWGFKFLGHRWAIVPKWTSHLWCLIPIRPRTDVFWPSLPWLCNSTKNHDLDFWWLHWIGS